MKNLEIPIVENGEGWLYSIRDKHGTDITFAEVRALLLVAFFVVIVAFVALEELDLGKSFEDVATAIVHYKGLYSKYTLS